MNVFVQKLSRLQRTYSTLLRLSDKSGYLQCTAAVKAKRTSDILTRLRMQHAICTGNDFRREFAAPVANHHQRLVNENDEEKTPKKSKENAYAHNVLLRSIYYAESMMQENKVYAYVTCEEALKILEENSDNEQCLTNNKVLSMVKKLSYNICCSDERIDAAMYEKFFHMLGKQLKRLSDDNLKIMMRHLVPFGKHLSSSNFYEIFCKQLNKECLSRFTQLQINESLLLCDMMYQMNCQNSEFIWHIMRKLGNRPNKLNSHQLVQLLFLLNVSRKPSINMYEIEYKLEQCIDELSVNELGVALLGFFKTGTPIRSSSLIQRIIRKTIANIEFVDNISIAGILKVLRFSLQLPSIPLLQDLMQCLMLHLHQFSLMTLVHLSHVCARAMFHNEELINKIIDRLNSEVKTVRLKDIERLLFVFSTLNIDPSNSVYQNVINELRTTWDTTRAWEISSFPQVASRILGYLAVLNIYPLDLIERIIAPEFLRQAYKNNYTFLGREYCVLDYSLRIEVPEYNGPLLKPNICNMLEKKYYQEFFESTMAENTRTKLFLDELFQTCQEMFNTTSNVSVIRLLPHYAIPDIVFCLDKQNKLMPSENFLSQFGNSEIMRVDKESAKDVNWISLILAHQGLLIRNINLPVGHVAAKMRQLPIIGYTPVLVSHIDWQECRSLQQRYDYIQKLIADALKSSNSNIAHKST